MTSLWSVSSDKGVSLGAEEFVGLLRIHHDRVIEAWRGFSAEQWEQPSRNDQWSVHETVRHVADVMELFTAEILDEPRPFSLQEFDPVSTPKRWLTTSGDDTPDRTIERFTSAAGRLRTRVGERMMANDASLGPTVGGPAHWSVMVVHLFWDSWLHERDVLLPLDFPARSSEQEQRLIALYSLFVAMVPAKMMKRQFAATVLFTGPVGNTVTAAHESGRLSSAETETAETSLSGDLGTLVDALSGRGTPLNEVLMGAPDLLGLFAQFMVK